MEVSSSPDAHDLQQTLWNISIKHALNSLLKILMYALNKEKFQSLLFSCACIICRSGAIKNSFACLLSHTSPE